ncbi:MAG: hypothetical protein BIFFINMI_03253 [Phycisphaerae bacterium]|nr:hypothetical protein [Phycisphaerae bacterium]
MGGVVKPMHAIRHILIGLLLAATTALARGDGPPAGGDQAAGPGAPADEAVTIPEEFRVKPEQVFEFTQAPQISRSGDRVRIRFASKGYCDVTIAIEDARGNILRHLVSGVLGPNAPEPLAKNSLAQDVTWDGKDDQGRYLDNKDSLRVRVSLGLRPQFERTLFWSPHKRMAGPTPLLVARPEGVYLFEGSGMDHVRLYDHAGNYLRTVYPFPADRVGQVAGLETRVFPQDGKRWPVKHGFDQASLLTSGTSCLIGLKYKFGTGYGATAMAVAPTDAGKPARIALAYDRINRFSSDGGSPMGADGKPAPMTGPKVSSTARWHGYGGQEGGEEIIGPASMAFSPDGKWLYLTGFMWRVFYMGGGDALQGVLRIPYEGDGPVEVFAGKMTRDGYGKGEGQFCVPSSVAVDAAGRVYVADHMNDRVQVFGPDGKLLKSFASQKPAQVLVNPRNGEIWVFSWPIIGISNEMLDRTKFEWSKVPPTLTRYRSFERPERVGGGPLPFGVGWRGFFVSGAMVSVAVDWWADSPTMWVVGHKHNISRIDVAWGGVGAYGARAKDAWMGDGVHIFHEEGGVWKAERDFAVDARKAVYRLKPPDFSRQRMTVNPVDGKLYVMEDSGFSKSFYEMLQIDPDTGKVAPVELPFDTEDLCFDLDGRAYLRTDQLVVRYDPKTWREVPWDYGEEHQKVGFTTLGGSKRADVTAGLSTPGVRPVCWHEGGMAVSPKGYLVVSCTSRAQMPDRRKGESSPWDSTWNSVTGKPYTPTIYPGRVRWEEVHVWDEHGKLFREDAAPGMHILNGVAMDARDNIYVLAAANRYLNGKPYWNEMAGTLVKVPLRGSKVISSSAGVVPLAKENAPRRPYDLGNGKIGSAWVEGADWLYGGVGFDGFNPSHSGGGCACWNSRFALDLFARSFAPEVDHYSVAVLDTSGNLICRVGRYGNVDDGKPLTPAGGPADARSIGGDEVALFHAAYVATHSDHRLFIADPGNCRILEVRLGYHASRTLPLIDAAGPPADSQ